MYLHLGQDTVIDDKSIVAMFDIDACTVSKKTRDFWRRHKRTEKSSMCHLNCRARLWCAGKTAGMLFTSPSYPQRH